MPRPKSKTDLQQLSKKNYEKLLGFIGSLPETERHATFPEGYLNRNIRDVLAHLHHWHLMMLNWYQVGMAGEKPEMPAKGHTWKTVPDLNREIWEQYQSTSLEEVKSLLDQSFTDVKALIDAHSDEELFEKKKYKWTGSTSLGAYLISATSSHYDWAFKLIRKCRKKS